MGFEKGHKKFGGREVGTPNKLTKDLRELISKAIDTDKIKCMLNQIEDPVDYINAVSKLLPYIAGKVKPIDIMQEEDRNIVINIVPYEEE